MKQEKKKMVLMVVAVVLLITVVIGSALAYFIAQLDSGASTNVSVTTGTTDTLLFATGDPISIEADMSNFTSGAGNRSGSTTATATLIAGTNHTAKENYNIYLNIERNDFQYTTDAKTPELVLKLTRTDNTGTTEVKAIDGLTYNDTSKGFDITTELGQIKLASNHEITTSTRVEQTWTVEVTFVNLDSDQNKNTGCTFSAYLYIQKEEQEYRPTLADVCNDGDNLAGCITTYNNNYDYETTKLIKHDGTHTEDANDGSIRYSGGDQYGIDENIFGVEKIYYANQTVHYSSQDPLLSLYAENIISFYGKYMLSGDKTINIDMLSEEELFVLALSFKKCDSDNDSIEICLNNIITMETTGNDMYIYSVEFAPKVLEKTEAEKLALFDKTTSVSIPIYYYKGNTEYNEKVKRYMSIMSKVLQNGESSLTEEEQNFMANNSEIQNSVFITNKLAMEDAYEKGLINNSRKDLVNNFVCFGSDDSVCRTDNLYRIIGVFNNQVKLIKYDYANSDMLGIDGDYSTSTDSKSNESSYRGNHETINNYYWNYKANNTSSNDWETSLLNKTNLNTNYITYLNKQNIKWANMIADTKWNIGGYNDYNAPAKTLYNAEKAKQASEATKIGLMTLSENQYSYIPYLWDDITKALFFGGNPFFAWMYMGLSEWTITPDSSDSSSTFFESSFGGVGINNASTSHLVRPVFYLKNTIKYDRGDGTILNPLRIK